MDDLAFPEAYSEDAGFLLNCVIYFIIKANPRIKVLLGPLRAYRLAGECIQQDCCD